jgi:hypothetical protein
MASPFSAHPPLRNPVAPLRWYVVVLLGLMLLTLSACQGGGAVVFAPTAPPPDTSPLRYDHPSGAFALQVPRQWSLTERNVLTLATATFSAPNRHDPVLHIAAVTLPPDTPLDAAAVNTLLDMYQTQVRPDAARYHEQQREVMGDGSWRMTGIVQTAGGRPQPTNTFIQLNTHLLAVVEVWLTGDAALDTTLQAVINSLALGAPETIAVSDLNTLQFAAPVQLAPLNLLTWTTDENVFFVTGELANTGDMLWPPVPVRVVLRTLDGRIVAEGTDVTMGHGLYPGEFAPFSLRFGGGQPALTTDYILTFGAADWPPAEPLTVYGRDVLTWTDQALYSDDGRLTVSGEVTNVSADTYVYRPRAVVTVFNDAQKVIAAGFSDLADVEIAPNETTPFEVIIPEMGGVPARTIVNIQATP